MVKNLKIIIFWLLLFIISAILNLAFGKSQEGIEKKIINEEFLYQKNIQKVVILKPTDKKKNNVPIYEIFSEEAENKKIVEELFQTSFMRNSVRLYFLAQNYLINSGILEKQEPAYLLLSYNQGGFPRFGFYFKKENKLIDKRHVPYIDLMKNNNRQEDYMGSMTQIYPHEMGHILYSMLSNKHEDDMPGSIDVHFVCITTDFRTAFDEGFAIHFENIAKEHEPDESLKKRIFNDIEHQKKRIEQRVAGYDRDFRFPLRLDYYRTTMILWYQNFEQLKRFEWVKSGTIKYKNAARNTNDIEKALFYRNSGIYFDEKHLRTIQQALSTEGVIASFFTALMESDLIHVYQEQDFYTKFLNEGEDFPLKPQEIFTPLENEYLKIFNVLKKHVNVSKPSQYPFLDFIVGYIKEFPEEKAEINRLVKFSTGYDFTDYIGPELWIMNKNYKHGFLIMDQFGANTLPLYTFNLNAADAIDLLTFKDISKGQAQKIIEYRKKKGLIKDFDELSSIPEVSQTTVALLKKSEFDADYVRNITQKLSFNIKGIFSGALIHLLLRGLLYYLIFMIGYYLIFLWKSEIKNKVRIKVIAGKFLKLFFMILLGLSGLLFFSNPLILFLPVVLLYMAIELFVRKDALKRKDAVLTSFIMVMMILYSLW
jgi:hypothetical protein